MTQKYKSEKFEFYARQFPRGKESFQHDPRRIFKSYDDLKRTYSEQFNLNILNGVFEAFIKCNTEDVVPLFSQVPDKRGYKKKRTYLYEFDKLVYTATVEVTVPQLQFVDKCIAIRLANDGFLYPKENELQGEWNLKPAHRSDEWYYLQEPEQLKLSALSDFAKKRLSGETKPVLRYRADEERVDFCLRDSHYNVVKFCYEYCPPTDDFPDHWMAEATPDSWFVVKGNCTRGLTEYWSLTCRKGASIEEEVKREEEEVIFKAEPTRTPQISTRPEVLRYWSIKINVES